MAELCLAGLVRAGGSTAPPLVSFYWHLHCTCTYLPVFTIYQYAVPTKCHLFSTCGLQVGSGKRDCVTHSLELTRQQKVAVLSRTNFGQFKVGLL